MKAWVNIEALKQNEKREVQFVLSLINNINFLCGQQNLYRNTLHENILYEQLMKYEAKPAFYSFSIARVTSSLNSFRSFIILYPKFKLTKELGVKR